MVLGPDHVNSSELQVWGTSHPGSCQGDGEQNQFLLCPPGTPASHPLCHV